MQRKLEREAAPKQQQLNADRQRFGALGLRAMALTAIAQFVTFLVLRSLFLGVVVATLPFEPPGLFKGVTQMGLKGAKGSDASFLLFYVLGNMGLKPLLAKALRLEPPKGSAGLGNPVADLSRQFLAGAR